MLEIEQKYAHADFAALEQRLAEWGLPQAEEHTEADHYLNAPDRDFAQTDEALRVRSVGAKNFITKLAHVTFEAYGGPQYLASAKVHRGARRRR